MKHPTNEEWMSYLYDEASPAETVSLKTHLEGCRECQAQVSLWQGTQTDLNTWQIPARTCTTQRRAPVASYLKWGIAAMLMLGAGYGFARVTAPSPDLATIRATLLPEFQQIVRRELDQTAAAAIATSNAESKRLVAELGRNLEATQQEDRLAVSEIFQRLEAKRVNDFVGLRRELETVAVNAESSLENAQQQIVQLASITQPLASASAPTDLK